MSDFALFELFRETVQPKKSRDIKRFLNLKKLKVATSVDKNLNHCFLNFLLFKKAA